MGSQWEDRSKSHLNIVFIGHVDHGKSTTVGRLLLDSGHIEEHEVEKNEKLAAESGKAGFGLAYVMDGLKEERVVLLSTLLTRNSSHLTTTGLLLTLQVTVIS
jgi:elongation factor 1-alpha